MPHHLPTTLTVIASLAGLAAAQDETTASVYLTHDDADGIVLVGESVTWTLTIEVENAVLPSGSNIEILGNNSLGSASDFNYSEVYCAFNGGTNGGDSNGAGIGFISFTASMFLDVFGGCGLSYDNPKEIGTFEFTAESAGVLEYQFARGLATSAFVSADISVFQQVNFQNPEDVTIVTDTLTIVPTPGTAALLGFGGLLASPRRRRCAKR